MKAGERWRTSVTCSEIALSLRANWPWHLVLATMSTLVFVFVTYTDASAVVDSVQAERSLTDRGQYAVIAQSTATEGDPTLDTRTCVALGAQTEVVASGSLRFVGSGEAANHPGTPFRVYLGSGQVRGVLDPSDIDGGSSGISDSLARQIGIAEDSNASVRVFPRDTDQAVIVGTVDGARWFSPSPRHEFGDTMWILGQPTTHSDECWIEFTPNAAQHARSITRSAFAFSEQVSVVDVVDPETRGSEPVEVFERRAAANLHYVIGATLGVLFGLVLWFQRARGALYRSLGAGRMRVAIMAAIESSWVLVLSAVCGLSISALLVSDVEGVSTIGVWPPVFGGLVSVLAAAQAVIAIAAAVLSSGNILSQLKDRL